LQDKLPGEKVVEQVHGEQRRLIVNGSRYGAYRQSDVLTADPKRLLILCYEETIRMLNMAKTSYASLDYEAKGRAVQKALDLISELREALDFEKGGSIAIHLDGLYAFMSRHIIDSDRKKNLDGFSHVAQMLEELKAAWEQALYGRRDQEHAPRAQAALSRSL
jgi:flagellar secretion chaperone FliS